MTDGGMKMKKIVVFGCQLIAVDFIEYLIGLEDVQLPLVITYELPLDRTYGYRSVSELCENKKIEYIASPKIPASTKEMIKSIRPDIIMSVYYRRIIPEEIFGVAAGGTFNIHPSLLPNYRGPVPTMWAIENGEKEFGITIHKIDKGIDTGDIVVQERYPILDDETGYSLYVKAMHLGADLLRRTFPKLLTNQYEPKRQQGIGSYYGKYNGTGYINWAQPAERIRDFIRARAKPFNPAQSQLFNAYVFVNRASVIRDAAYPAQPPGRILEVMSDGRLIVSCAEGCLRLDEFAIYPPLDKVAESVYLKRGVSFG